MNQEQVTAENTEEKAAEVTASSEMAGQTQEAVRPKGKWFGRGIYGSKDVPIRILDGLIGVLIVITWLSVMCLLIKCDVGGFGSRVLRPVFKDVPMINKILPDASDEEVAIESDYP